MRFALRVAVLTLILAAGAATFDCPMPRPIPVPQVAGAIHAIANIGGLV
jgi:hypothetical protein